MKKLNQNLVQVFASVLLLTISMVAFAAPPAPLSETGQTTCTDTAGTEIICSGTGQDGDLRKGIKWPVPRLTDNGNGTVTDHLTGLIWVQYLRCYQSNWMNALVFANTLADGTCYLTDGSLPGDWRMPNIRELRSIMDFDNAPALPSGHPFLSPNMHAIFFWSSTSVFPAGTDVHAMQLSSGEGWSAQKSYEGSIMHVWAVRDAPPPPTQCSDEIDNDNDGYIDMDDRQCRSLDQDSEKHPNR